MNPHNILINFLTKYLFILNAASDGWSICYIGGNRFEFKKVVIHNEYNEYDDCKQFIKKCSSFNHKLNNIYPHLLPKVQ